MSEETFKDWKVSPDTPCTIITDHGRISVSWASTDKSRDQLAESAARRIVQCVNAHDELVAALENLLRICDHASADAFKNGVADPCGSMDEGDSWASEAMDAARAALAKATPSRSEAGR